LARCERGYLCAVCGREVEEIEESELYLRYVLGEADADFLHRLPEKHIRCDPVLAQFIVTESFEPVALEGAFSKANLDPEFVSSEEARVTRGYLRLCEVAQTRVPIWEYPLPEVRARQVSRSTPTAERTPGADAAGPSASPLDGDPS
jgi:hypothetical protein